MRILLLSDVHSNLAALEAVARDAESRGTVDAVWGLGDLVGYGPQPGECLARLRGWDFRSVAGNHDLAVIGAIDTKDFNHAAAEANEWNAERLSPEDRSFISSLPLTIVEGDLSLAHGSLRAPVWEYMISVPAALAQFRHMSTRYSVVGHTHVPLAFEEGQGDAGPEYWQLEDGETIELGDRRLILNPGSVGQPRDGDPRAAYAIFDSEAALVRFHRVEYDVKLTQRLMKAAGLPDRLVSRLARGR